MANARRSIKSAGGALLRGAAPLIAGRAGAAALGFLLPMVLARALDAAAFGTYKQAFLLAATLQYLLQLGLAQSLYYFLPRAGSRRGVYLVNALVLLAGAGAAAALGLLAFGRVVARAFANPELERLMPWASAYAGLVIATAPLEISLTAVGHTRASALTFFSSEALRVGAMAWAAWRGTGVAGVLVGATAVAGVRLLATWLALPWVVGRGRLQGTVVAEQLRYAIPFAAAVAMGTVQQQVHLYVVGAAVDPAAYAVYAVGCFQVPLVALLYTPMSEILQVRIGEADTAGQPERAAALLSEAVGRLALPLLPLFAFLWIAAPQIIRVFYTDAYLAAVPIFRAFVLTVPAAIFTVDGVLRARARTRALSSLYAAKLAATAVLVLAGLRGLGLVGAALGFALCECGARLVTLRAAARVVGASFAGAAPWGLLARIALASLGAVAAALLASAVHVRPLPQLALMGAAFGAVLVVLLAGLGALPVRARALAAAAGRADLA